MADWAEHFGFAQQRSHPSDAVGVVAHMIRPMPGDDLHQEGSAASSTPRPSGRSASACSSAQRRLTAVGSESLNNGIADESGPGAREMTGNVVHAGDHLREPFSRRRRKPVVVRLGREHDNDRVRGACLRSLSVRSPVRRRRPAGPRLWPDSAPKPGEVFIYADRSCRSLGVADRDATGLAQCEGLFRAFGQQSFHLPSGRGGGLCGLLDEFDGRQVRVGQRLWGEGRAQFPHDRQCDLEWQLNPAPPSERQQQPTISQPIGGCRTRTVWVQTELAVGPRPLICSKQRASAH